MRAVALVCFLAASPARSSSHHIAEQVLAQFARHDVQGEIVRIADHDVRPGTRVDMGDSDSWPAIREKVLAADILVIATPIWLGRPSSVCQRVLERLNAKSSETDGQGRPHTYGKVAAVAVDGNEDGAHKVNANVFQGFNDVGFSPAPGAVTYWVSEALQGTDYQDLDETPEAVASTTETLASNAVHLARRLTGRPYPAA